MRSLAEKMRSRASDQEAWLELLDAAEGVLARLCEGGKKADLAAAHDALRRCTNRLTREIK